MEEDAKLNCAIVRANTLQDLDEAFSCGLIKLYSDPQSMMNLRFSSPRG
jgi:hypothetical protein